MDIHIIYHIVVYTIIFIPTYLLFRKDMYFFLTLLVTLPIVGELTQLFLVKNFPSVSYFSFSFEYFDIVTNMIGALIGTGLSWLLSSLK